VERRAWERWGARAGLAFPVLAVGGGFIGGLPSDEDPATFTRAFAQLETRQHLQAAVSVFAVFLFLCFLGSLHAKISRSDPGSTSLSTLIVGAGYRSQCRPGTEAGSSSGQGYRSQCGTEVPNSSKIGTFFEWSRGDSNP